MQTQVCVHKSPCPKKFLNVMYQGEDNNSEQETQKLTENGNGNEKKANFTK